MLTAKIDRSELKQYTDEKEYLAYQIGALLYTPAINTSIAEKIKSNSIDKLTSIALCLEDSIQEGALCQAEEALKETLTSLEKADNLPLIFIRVRTASHLIHVHTVLGECADLITGYILPKFDMTNADDYKKVILTINENRSTPLYFMPILESEAVARLPERAYNLKCIKSVLDYVKPYILNVRVGGNDLSNLYGVRRAVDQTVYDIGVVRDVLVDIINVFATDYIVSGPVWEYFGEEGGVWETGLRKELRLDRLNGFLGKTAIHPTQLPVIYDSLKVDESDYLDAQRLLHWDSEVSGVESSADRSRMNEVKCHSNWAKRIALLGEIYGVRRK